MQTVGIILHWATLLQGAMLAWEEDESRSNSVVQISVAAGLANCKIFHKRTPPYIVRYLVDLGNSMNLETSGTTFLEVLKSVEQVEAAWSKKKHR